MWPEKPEYHFLADPNHHGYDFVLAVAADVNAPEALTVLLGDSPTVAPRVTPALEMIVNETVQQSDAGTLTLFRDSLQDPVSRTNMAEIAAGVFRASFPVYV